MRTAATEAKSTRATGPRRGWIGGLLAGAALTACCWATAVHGAEIAYEGIDGSINSGTGWAANWAGPGLPTPEPGLTFGALPVAGGSFGGGWYDAARSLATPPNPVTQTVYMSFLVQADSSLPNEWRRGEMRLNKEIANNFDFSFMVERDNSATASLQFYYTSPSYGGPLASGELAYGTPYFHLVKFSNSAGAVRIDIWRYADPADLPATEPTTADPAYLGNDTQTVSAPALSTITLNGYNCDSFFDEIRIGTAFADVIGGLAFANLTMAVSPAATGTTTPAAGVHAVAVGAPQAITASPAAGKVFVNWTATANAEVASPNSASTTVTLTGDATVTANFADEPAEQGTLTMAVNDAAAGTTDPAVGAHAVNVGVATAITATANPGYAFNGWTLVTGSATIANANAASTTVTLLNTGGATVRANFLAETTLTMAVDDVLGGDVEPAVGDHTVYVGQAVSITATANDGFAFAGWLATAEAELDDANAAQTTVTLSGGATVTATFVELELVACGSVFPVTADEMGLAGDFDVKPKLYATYTDFVSRTPGKKAAVKLLTKLFPTDNVDGAWGKKIRLLNLKLLAARNKLGTTTTQWLLDNPTQNQPLDLNLRMASKQAGIGDKLVRTLSLAPVRIDQVEVLANEGIIEITGAWFGTKKPKVWMEYVVPGKGVKKLKAKILAADGAFVDGKGKAVYMDPGKGTSKVVILLPIKLPAGIAGWESVNSIVIDNGCGYGTSAIDLAN